MTIIARIMRPIIRTQIVRKQIRIAITSGLRAASNIASGSSLLIDYITSVNVNKFDPITADGKICDSNNIAHREKMIGLATETIASAHGSKVWGNGQIQNSVWSWTVGAIIFLVGTSLSMSPPNSSNSIYSLIVGRAIKTDTIDLQIQQSFGF